MFFLLKRYYHLFLFGAAVLLGAVMFFSVSDGNLRVWALDVGQGDAVFIETPGKRQVLIDGGPNAKVLSELSAVMPFYDKSIDLMVLTHPQEDHIFGLVEVLKRYQVANVLMTAVAYHTATYEEFKKLLQEEGARVFIARAGQNIKLDTQTTLDVLYPFEGLLGREIPEDLVNDTSVAVRLTFGEKKFLFLGDATLKEEVELVNSGQDIDVDVLKLSHHGSKTSSSQLFLEKTTPAIAFASLGRNNRYGHPHQDVVERLKDISFYRTDASGRITIVSDGKRVEVETER